MNDTFNPQKGERVRFRTEVAHIYDDSEWGEKLSKPRLGTIIEVPWAAANTGEGTVLVEWDSLTGPKADPVKWQHWHHTDNLYRDEGGAS